MITHILLAIVVIHLIAGFGWMIYKLAPRDSEGLIDNSDDETDST